MGDYSDRYRPRNLVTLQRAFLRLMTERPELATKVKAFTWTLVWQDFDDEGLTGIDLQTWNVFSLMENVTHLDLASLHEIGWEPFIRQNPARLFPSVTHLRLVGWMHRGLVKAIVSSLDASRLVYLNLDHLQDEGALPNGKPMEDDWARENVYRLETGGDIDDGLFARQERGGVAIFPGPMWYPLRLLRQQSLTSMSHLDIRIGPVDRQIDQRNYIFMFKEVSNFIRSAKSTLKDIHIGLGEAPHQHCPDEHLRSICGTSRVRTGTYRAFSFHMASTFLHHLLTALTEEFYPHLTRVNLEGFRVMQTDGSRWSSHHELRRQCIQACPFVDEDFIKTANVDYRQPFVGPSERRVPARMEANRMFDSLESLESPLLSPGGPQEARPRRQRQRRWHPRTFTGCFNCRKRHVKCDEKSPSCANCRRLSLDCRYESGGRFTFRAVRPAQGVRSSPRGNEKAASKPREELPQTTLSPEKFVTTANLDIGADIETPTSLRDVDDLVLTKVAEQGTWDSQLSSFLDLFPLPSPIFADISTPDTTYYHHFIDTVSTMLIIWDTPSNSNPYRLLPRLADTSGLLRNTMIALGAMHMANLPEMAQRNAHQRAAMEAYGSVITQLKSLRPIEQMNSELELLATTLLLCMFEKMNSADSSWKVHLEGARQIFETIYRPRPLALTASRMGDQHPGSNLIAFGYTEPSLIAPMRRFLVSLMAYLDVAAACATGKGTLIPGDYWETLGGGWEYNLGAPSFQPPRTPTDRSLGQIRQSWSRLMAIQADISGFASMDGIDDVRREIIRESLARRIADWHESGPDVYVRLSALDAIPLEESEAEVELLRAAACVQCYASACSIYLDRVATQKLCRGATETEIAAAAENIIRLSSNFSGGLSRMAHLWSLFTAGTATTDDAQKEALRDVLTEMKSFGFKHISRALDILEYVWLQQRLYGEAEYQAFTELASTALFP